MRETVECGACGMCAYVLPPGFTSVPEYYCTQFEAEVEQDDGCTFGSPGEPYQSPPDYDVYLSGHPSDGLTDMW